MDKLCPRILIDTREQKPLRFSAYPSERATLSVGDYGVAGLSDWSCPRFVVERKSLPDLTQSLTRERDRFLREAERLAQFRFAGLVVEGYRTAAEAGIYRSAVAPEALLQSVAVLEVRYGIHVAWCGTPEGAAWQVEAWVRQTVRGLVKDLRRLQKGAV